MEKLEIVKLFLANELQLTPQALELIYKSQNDIERIINYAKEMKLWIIDEDDLEEFRRSKTNDIISNKIDVVYPEEIMEFSTEDIIRALKYRFEFLSQIINENNRLPDLTSLSKVKKLKKGEEATVIGMVRDKTTYSILLEDFTSHETIRMDANLVEKLFYDDVVAIKIKRYDEKLIGDKIFFPSLSFFRKPAVLKEDVIVSMQEIKVGNYTYQLMLKDVAKVYINDFKMTILDSLIVRKYQRKGEKDIDTLISLLERRHLNPSFIISKKLYKKDLFLLDEIPDAIIVTSADEFIYKPYKGINIFFLPNGGKLSLKEKRIV